MSRKNADPPTSWSSSDEEGDDDDEEGDDEMYNQEDLFFYPICCRSTSDTSKSHPSPEAALKHDLAVHKFDLLAFLPPPSSDDFLEKAIICVNKCRSFVACSLGGDDDDETVGKKLTDYLNSCNNQGDTATDETFFRPVLQDDALLMCMDDLEDLQTKRFEKSVQLQETGTADHELQQLASALTLNNTNSDLEMKLSALEEQLARARACIANLINDKEDSPVPGQKQVKPKLDNDTYYFSSYSHSSIHETMLKDRVRTEAYQNAILFNSSELFKDKVVMDIGCGTGILSLFAAKAGAKRVYAIDASDIYKEASDIIHLNGYQNIITVLHGKVEDLIANGKIPLGENKEVDVIISEWMGYGLFFETMLPSVLNARDILMNKTNGTMYPNRSTIYLEGAFDSSLEYWNDVYGINMIPMKTRVARELKKESSVEIVKATDIVTNRIMLKEWDLNLCKDDDLDFQVPFKLNPNRTTFTDTTEVQGDNSKQAPVKIDKLVISFDIDFDLPGTTPVSFSTGCQSEPTHWKQTSVWFDPTEHEPTLQLGEIMKGTFQMGRNSNNPREMDIFVSWQVGFERDSLNNTAGEKSFVQRCGGNLTSKLSA